MTDARVREMKGLKRLKTLGLGGCDVTDAVVDDLKRFPALSVLDLEYSSVTSEGAARLRKALPKCELHYVKTR